MRFYPRRVPKDGQGECDHIYSPVLGADRQPIGQHCPLCNQFNSLEDVKALWAAADAKKAQEAASAFSKKEIDHLSVVTHYILTPLLIIVAVILVLEYYGILILPH